MAQEKGKIRLGAGVVYGTEASLGDDSDNKGGIGFNLGGEYFITDKISAAPSFTYFMKSETDFLGGKLSGQPSSLNLDGRFYTGDGDVVFYGLVGLSMGFAKTEIKDSEVVENSSDSDNKAGINVGVGLVYPINERIGLNGQVKYNSPYEQLEIQAGITFTLN